MNFFTCSNEAYEEMTKEARRAYPKECCGILFGREREIRYAFPVQNVVSEQNSRRHFEMDPLIVYQAECEAEKRGMEMLGIYHSHPDSPPIPSSEDLAYMIPGISYWILSVEQGIEKELRGYAKEPDQKKPVSIRIEKGAAASCRF